MLSESSSTATLDPVDPWGIKQRQKQIEIEFKIEKLKTVLLTSKGRLLVSEKTPQGSLWDVHFVIYNLEGSHGN